jgi:mannose-6-phosphate isomerase-like protein (cupin superfamily)
MQQDQNLSRRGMLAAAAAAFGPILVRHESDVPDSESRCGIEKGLCGSIDGGAARACSMTLTSVEAHYHKRTTEIYYVLDGHGVARLNGEEHQLRKGSFLHIPPGVVHSFTGSAKVLIVGVPAISTDEDMFFPSPPKADSPATG